MTRDIKIGTIILFAYSIKYLHKYLLDTNLTFQSIVNRLTQAYNLSHTVIFLSNLSLENIPDYISQYISIPIVVLTLETLLYLNEKTIINNK